MATGRPTCRSGSGGRRSSPTSGSCGTRSGMPAGFGAPSTAVTAVSPEGSRVPLLDSLHRVSRPDVEELYGAGAERKRRHGLLRYFKLPVPSHMPDGWVFEMENAAGITTEAPGPATMR